MSGRQSVPVNARNFGRVSVFQTACTLTDQSMISTCLNLNSWSLDVEDVNDQNRFHVSQRQN